jgi:protein-S-isoprenylcysteine O-methyltransferase Ste14
MNILTLRVTEPSLLLILMGVVHLSFRLSYVFFIGFRLRAAQSDRTSNNDEQYAKWLRFKKQAMFILNGDGVTLAFVIALSLNSITGSAHLVYLRIIGALFIIIGIGVKRSAYRVTGDKGYYWYNFFCADEEREYIATGVYKYLNNPMYGLGYLHAVGFPLLFLSFWGLVLALFAWLAVWAFYVLFERPHTHYYRH